MEDKQQQRAYVLGQPRAIRLTDSDSMPRYVNTQWITYVEHDTLIKRRSYVHLLGGGKVSTDMPVEDVLALWAGRG
jgi:hypothetical protein